MATKAPPAIKHLRTLRHVFGGNAEREKRLLLAQLRTVRLLTHAQVNALHEDLLFRVRVSRRFVDARAGARGCWPRSASGTRLSSSQRTCAGRGFRNRRLDHAARVSLFHRALARARGSRRSGDRLAQLRRSIATGWLRRPAAARRRTRSVRQRRVHARASAFDWRAARTRRPDLEWLMEAAAASPHAGGTPRRRLGRRRSPAGMEASRFALARSTHNSVVRRADQLSQQLAATGGRRQSPISSARRNPSSGCRGGERSSVIAVGPRGACRALPRGQRDDLSQRDEICWCDLGEGVALAVIGIAREHRLTLETNTGYLLFANGVPIGYGGVTPLFRQANTGINIFDPFRGGEAAYLWTQMLRAFHTLYGSRALRHQCLSVRRRQRRGHPAAARSGSTTGLASGRRSAATRALAAREAKRMAADRKYRSDARTLRALAYRRSVPRLAWLRSGRLLRRSAVAAVRARCAARQLANVRVWPSRAGAQRQLVAARRRGSWHRRSRPMAGARATRLRVPGAGRRESWRACPTGARADREALAAMMRAKGSAAGAHVRVALAAGATRVPCIATRARGRVKKGRRSPAGL